MKKICALSLLMLAGNMIQAQPIPVPNGQFSLPYTTYAFPVIASWEIQPPNDNFGMGVFTNNPVYGPSEYIVNDVGGQAAYMFADPGFTFFQDAQSVDLFGDPSAFNATFDVGKAYQLITGITGSGVEPLTPGVTLQMSLYYRDSLNNMVTVASTNVVYDPDIFTPTNFVACELDTAIVQSTDAWAGQNIGIQFLSLATEDDEGGTWDLNNVQLFGTPYLDSPGWTNNQFTATLRAPPGMRFQILSTSDLTQPVQNWSPVTTFFTSSGQTPVVDPSASASQKFYTARQKQIFAVAVH
jgi:hypothetical protein